MNKKNTQNIIDKFLDYILKCIFVILIVITTYIIYKIYNLLILYKFWISPLIQFYLILFLFLLSFIILTRFIFNFNKKIKNNFTLFILSSAITIYSIEVLNELIFPSFNAQDGALYIEKIKNNYSKKNNFVLDKRSIYEFINDNRKNNIESYPNFKPNMLIKHNEGNNSIKDLNNGFETIEGNLLPLSNISNIITTTGNEGGFYPIIKTDKYGFNNNNNVYEKKIDIALIGDSFVEGSDVNTVNNISSNLIKNNFNTLNLGKSHSGPLVQLAIFKEYLVVHKPKKVLWFYFVNDHKDLNNELNSSLLLNYLKDQSFSQNLLKKQKLINSEIKKYFSNLEKNYLENLNKQNKYFSIGSVQSLNLKRMIRVIKLFNIRNRFGLLIDMKPFNSDNEHIKIQKDIVRLADNIVKEWNGELIFVLIPQYTKGMSFASQEMNWVVETNITNNLIKILKENNITYINLEDHINNHTDPLSLYPFRIPLHFNEKGYSFISNILIDQLKKN